MEVLYHIRPYFGRFDRTAHSQMFVNLFKVAIYHDVSLAAWIFFRPVDVCDLGRKGMGKPTGLEEQEEAADCQ